MFPLRLVDQAEAPGILPKFCAWFVVVRLYPLRTFPFPRGVASRAAGQMLARGKHSSKPSVPTPRELTRPTLHAANALSFQRNAARTMNELQIGGETRSMSSLPLHWEYAPLDRPK